MLIGKFVYDVVMFSGMLLAFCILVSMIGGGKE